MTESIWRDARSDSATTGARRLWKWDCDGAYAFLSSCGRVNRADSCQGRTNCLAAAKIGFCSARAGGGSVLFWGTAWHREARRAPEEAVEKYASAMSDEKH